MNEKREAVDGRGNAESRTHHKINTLRLKNIYRVHERKTECYKTGIGYKKDFQKIFKN